MDALLYEVISEMAHTIQVNKEFLTELDREIGDGDHGINMARGFTHVMNKVNLEDELSLSDALKKVGMTIISTVGGASGPLYGSAFLKAAMAVREKTELSGEVLDILLKASLEGVQERGKAVQGDKTIIDALEPAYVAYTTAFALGQTPIEGMKKACEAAYEGVESTKLFVAKKGRASYLGMRSIGHQDPGATSTLLLLQALTRVLER
ncbi:MAG: dihydroxyacetone kinase subunit DhaL [Niameybacter sp.]|uniref:dihydroxyacetone kinase subunit DhaL n=1 Tax=Niameybacter sp. TaxID=2033640 RepID=UPI002FC925A3